MLRATLALSLTTFSVLASAHAQPTDAHGDPLPPNAVARIGTTRFRHAAEVASLAFSSDGKRISSSTIWFDVGVWEAHTGQELAFRSSRRQEGVFRAAVSPDGSLFAGRLDNGDLGVQRALDGKIIHRFESEDKKQRCDGLVFSRDNRWLASADDDGNTFLWDLQTGKLSHQFKTKPRDLFDEFCHAFTPDGAVFIQARRDRTTLWNVETGKAICRIDSKKEEKWPSEAAVSPDGALLAIRIAYGEVDLWEITSGRQVRTVADQWNEVGPVFSPDGKQIVTAGRGGESSFWEVGAKIHFAAGTTSHEFRLLARWENSGHRRQRPCDSSLGSGAGKGKGSSSGQKQRGRNALCAFPIGRQDASCAFPIRDQSP
jgi:WD40 repeat protein